MFVFSTVIYLRSCISEVHSNNTCFSINKKKSVVTARLEPTPSKTTLDLVLVLSPPLYQLSYHSAEGEGLFQIYEIYNYKREREGYTGIYIMY